MSATDVYELLTKADRESYSPNSFFRELQTVCDPIDVTLNKDRQLSVHGFEIQPGRRHEKTGLMLSSEDGPDKPIFSYRPSRAGFSTYQEISENAGYAAVVCVGPHSVKCVTSTDAHHYLTTQVNSDISGPDHLSYLSIETCTEMLEKFFNPQIATDTSDTGQQSLYDY
ncbi:hypothetical protein [Natronorubrum sp. DTA7]|uniref:hypothetical protein n=1 Tax=Natronorubrum sp. DTA7 TaxID=3447016 RepID=UPI003F856301